MFDNGSFLRRRRRFKKKELPPNGTTKLHDALKTLDKYGNQVHHSGHQNAPDEKQQRGNRNMTQEAISTTVSLQPNHCENQITKDDYRRSAIDAQAHFEADSQNYPSITTTTATNQAVDDYPLGHIRRNGHINIWQSVDQDNQETMLHNGRERRQFHAFEQYHYPAQALHHQHQEPISSSSSTGSPNNSICSSSSASSSSSSSSSSPDQQTILDQGNQSALQMLAPKIESQYEPLGAGPITFHHH